MTTTTTNTTPVVKTRPVVQKRKKSRVVDKFDGNVSPEPEVLSDSTELRLWSEFHGCNVSMTARWERITPAYARYVWNHLNKANRGLRPGAASVIQHSVEKGEFLPTGQAIIFDSAGDLQDGQHRIYAVANGTESIVALVVRGAPPENFTRIDTGKVRNGADTLQTRGISHAKLVAAVARRVKQFEDSHSISRRGSVLTNDEIIKFVAKRPRIQTSAEFVSKLFPSAYLSLMTETQATFVHFVVSGYNRDAADEFLRILTGPATNLIESGGKKEALKHLRDRFDALATARTKSRIRSEVPEMQVVGLTLAAWNNFARYGRKVMKKLQSPKSNEGKFTLPPRIKAPTDTALENISTARDRQETIRKLLEEQYGDRG